MKDKINTPIKTLNIKKRMNIPEFDHIKLLSKIRFNGECWEWIGSHDSYGYGKMEIKGKQYKSHRLSYELFLGIKKNYTSLDHLCRNRSCVNPDHIREVSIDVNTKENSVNRIGKVVNICIRGHIIGGKNERITKINVFGGISRQCKKCCAIRSKKKYIKVADRG